MDIMTADVQTGMKKHPDHVEHAHAGSDSSGSLEKGPTAAYDTKGTGIAIEDGEYVVTAKTWAVVLVCFGASEKDEDSEIS